MVLSVYYSGSVSPWLPPQRLTYFEICNEPRGYIIIPNDPEKNIITSTNNLYLHRSGLDSF